MISYDIYDSHLRVFYHQSRSKLKWTNSRNTCHWCKPCLTLVYATVIGSRSRRLWGPRSSRMKTLVCLSWWTWTWSLTSLGLRASARPPARNTRSRKPWRKWRLNGRRWGVEWSSLLMLCNMMWCICHWFLLFHLPAYKGEKFFFLKMEKIYLCLLSQN